MGAAESWFALETAGPLAGAEGARTTGGDPLREFFPDWEGGVVVEAPGGGSAVVTSLWRRAAVDYDPNLAVLRVLAVELDAAGDVERGRIVEFVSPDAIAEDDGPALVEGWLAEDFGERRVLAVEYTVTYDPVGARLFEPGQAALSVDVRTEDVEDPAAVQAAGTESAARRVYEYRCSITQVVQWEVGFGGDTVNSGQDLYYQCWLVYDPYGGGGGGDGGYGGGGGGGGSGGSTAGPSVSLSDDWSDEDPDCESPTTEAERIWCRSQVPEGGAHLQTQSAIDRIRARGGECANMADFLDFLLSRGGIRYYVPDGSESYGGYTMGSEGFFLSNTFLGEGAFTVEDDHGNEVRGNLDIGLAHEVEHYLGRGHIPGTNQTPNALRCAGLS